MLPEYQQVEKSWDEIYKSWEFNLKPYNVDLPKGQQRTMLVYLYMNLNKPVSLIDLRDFTLAYHPDGSQDKQPRHLKYMGWDVRLSGKSGDVNLSGERIKNGYVLLASVTHPSLVFIKNELKRRGRMSVKNFAELVSVYDDKCGMCGKFCKSFEQGHMNPRFPLTIDNTIPLCSSCNNWMGDDVVINDKGRVLYVLSDRFLKDTPIRDKHKILQSLKDGLFDGQ